ncbi:MAG: RNA 2',3'-cyclic phosphodiesterase [Synergistaceae bacterium]|nr:RNA 2',3'-cyclic phosphodiesterase [Synergistaceae bacterium]
MEALGEWLAAKKAVGAGIRWVAPKTIHITLKFCGEIHPDMVEAIARILEKEDLGGAVEISVSRVGGFPRLCAPKVIWTGICGETDKLRKLQQKTEECAFRCGVAKEWRKFSPHITLGRRNEQSPLPEGSVRIIEKHKIELPAWSVKEIIMMKSELTPRGPIYTPLKYFAL